MFKYNKLLTLLLTAAVSISSVTALAEGETSATTAPAAAEVTVDASTAAAENAVTVLRSLGMLPNIQFTVTDEISRADFAKVMCNFRNLQSVLSSMASVQKFSDVPSTHAAFKEINLLADLGIMNGVGGGMFNPDAKVSVEQVLKVFVTMLGYEQEAMFRGGYPSGYLAVALDLDLFEGVKTAFTAPALKGDIALIVCNAFDVEVRTLSSDGTYKGTGNDLLVEYWDYKKVEGLVEANEITAIDSLDTTGKDQVRIDGILLDTNEKTATAADLLGYYVEGYYKDDENGTTELAYLVPDDKNECLIIDGKDVTGYDSAQNRINYLSGDKGSKKYAKMSTVISVIYNGRYVAKYDESIFDDVNGTVELLKAGTDSTYGIAKITDYNTYFVSGVDAENGVIYNKYKPIDVIEIDEKTTDYVRIRNKAGVVMTAEQLKASDVISVAKSEDDKVVDIVVSNDTVSGMVSAVADEDEYKVSVNGTEYVVCDELVGVAEFEAMMGSNVTLYLDYLGQVAGSVTTTDAYKYGYIVEARPLVDDDEGYRLKIFTTDGKMTMFEVADRIKFDGGRLEELDLYAGLKYQTVDGSTTYDRVDQLVRFKTDAEGVIVEIDTAAGLTLGNKTIAQASTETEDSLHVLYSSGTSWIEYFSAPKSFGGKLNISATATVFRIPEKPYLETTEDADYTIANVGQFYNKSTYPVAGFATKADSLAAEIVVRPDGRAKSVGNNTAVVYVTNVGRAINHDETEGYSFTLLNDGKSATMVTESLDVENASLVEPGDAIRVATNSSGDIVSVQIAFDANGASFGVDVDGSRSYGTTGSYGSEYRAVFGRVVKKDDANMFLAYSDNKEDEKNGEYFAITANVRVYEYDSEAEPKFCVKESNINNILDSRYPEPSKVFMYCRAGEVKSIYIIK